MEISESMKPGQRAVEHDFLPGIEAQAASLAHARQEMANYRYELEHTTTEQQKFMTALSDTIVLLNAQFEADKKVRDAKLNAQVDAINRNPNLTEDLVVKRIAVEAAQRNAGVRVEQAERDRENADIADKQKAAAELKANQKGLDEAAFAAKKKASDEEADITNREGDIDEQKEAAAQSLRRSAKKPWINSTRKRKFPDREGAGFEGDIQREGKTADIKGIR